MELKVIEKSKNKIIIEIQNENHTLCNALKDELYNDDSVKSAGYFIKHPVLKVPTMVVETKQGTDVIKTINDAGNRLKKKNKKFIKEFEKEIK
ncbi:MAG: RpoL/Rpb11 RNA polymerase subunit family protein [Nanoarchaeota archaeon]